MVVASSSASEVHHVGDASRNDTNVLEGKARKLEKAEKKASAKQAKIDVFVAAQAAVDAAAAKASTAVTCVTCKHVFLTKWGRASHKCKGARQDVWAELERCRESLRGNSSRVVVTNSAKSVPANANVNSQCALEPDVSVYWPRGFGRRPARGPTKRFPIAAVEFMKQSFVETLAVARRKSLLSRLRQS